MAVYQVSKIQIRRGKTYGGTGLPQLASGELAWSIDTAELFIGNGSVAEGAPQVGNTKILTQNDLLSQGNLLNLTTHIYKANTLLTGVDSSHPTARSIQRTMDDTVNAEEFGAVHNGIVDDTDALQRAIDQLFLNASNPAYDTMADSVNTRVVLHLHPGIYLVTRTIYIPSYTTILGAGADKSIINFTGTGPVFKFINDSSTPTTRNPSATTGITQPKNVSIKGIGINSTDLATVPFKLESVKNSIIEDVAIHGNWGDTYNAAHRAIELNAVSSIVTSENNTFRNISIDGFSYGVYSKQDILNNVFENVKISNTRYGVEFGVNANGSSAGEEFGPRFTSFSNCSFNNIKRQAVYIDRGTGNQLSNIKLSNVGNDSGATPLYPQIYFQNHGNSVSQITSERFNTLAYSNTIRYIPEVAGHSEYIANTTYVKSIGQLSEYTSFLNLPVNTDAFGVAVGSVIYSIDYLYDSNEYNFTRKGTITISADATNGFIQLSDEYDYAGAGAISNQLALDFKAVFLDEIHEIYTGAEGQVPSSLAIQYVNQLTNDAGHLRFTYKMSF